MSHIFKKIFIASMLSIILIEQQNIIGCMSSPKLTPHEFADALIEAAKDNDINTVKKLLKRKTSTAMTSFGLPENIVKQININTSESSLAALHYAVNNENINMIKLLLDNGASINAQDPEGKTALHKAVDKENIDIVNLLLEGGANISIKTLSHKTALELAEEMPHAKAEMIEILKAELNKKLHSSSHN